MAQFSILGLGNFGSYLALHLSDKGHEVLVLDRDAARVQRLKDYVSRAVIADATDREVLETLGLAEMEAVVVCIGTEMTNSVLTTLLLGDIGVKRILAMGISEQHGRILAKVGAHEVLFPEKDLAITLGERLDNPNMLDYLPFVEGFSIAELAAPPELIGKSLRELDLVNRFGVQVVAIKEVLLDRVHMPPKAQFVIKDSDLLVLLGPNEAISRLRDLDSARS